MKLSLALNCVSTDHVCYTLTITMKSTTLEYTILPCAKANGRESVPAPTIVDRRMKIEENAVPRTANRNPLFDTVISLLEVTALLISVHIDQRILNII